MRSSLLKLLGLVLLCVGATHGMRLRVCVTTGKHHNHRTKMLSLIANRLSFRNFPVAALDAHVQRLRTGFFVTDLEVTSLTGDVTHLMIRSTNTRDAVAAIERNVGKLPLAFFTPVPRGVVPRCIPSPLKSSTKAKVLA